MDGVLHLVSFIIRHGHRNYTPYKPGHHEATLSVFCVHSEPQLLGGLLEINLAYVADVEEMKLAGQFFEFLSLEHSNNNVHNIRLCRQIIAAGTLPVSKLVKLQVADKVR